MSATDSRTDLAPATGPSAREVFAAASAAATSACRSDEVLVASLAGERSEFVRFNGPAIRQAGTVFDLRMDLELSLGRRGAQASLRLSGDPAIDAGRVRALVAELRDRIGAVPEDPFLSHAADVAPIDHVAPSTIPSGAEAVDAVLDAGRGRPLVGIYAAGTTVAGVTTTTGVDHWYESSTFNLDWSLYLGGDAEGDKAAKNAYAGTAWDPAAFARAMATTDRQVEALARPVLDLEPGRYRTYLAPAAMGELLDLLSWGGFGLKSHRTRSSPLLRMVTDDVAMHPAVSLGDEVGAGGAPPFSPAGFARPERVPLIDGGRYVGHLVSPRSGVEYGVATNGANDHEAPVALAMAAGDLPEATVLEALGTGIYVGNLWYLNFSDRPACRTTGMTRFATFWVEDGEIVAPIRVLRYDDTAYRMLGDELVGLTAETEFLLDPASYGARSTDSKRVPGALLEALSYTL